MAKKAFLVGINKYPGCPLAGCINDIKNIQNLLTTQYAFTSDQIKTLTDAEATTKQITAGLQWLVDGAKAGDMLVFWYSGHGAQVATGSQDEPDGLSEVICPVDFDWKPEHMITDKQFVQIFCKIPTGVLFNWGSDSCHSGDLDRNMPPKKGFFARLFGKKVVLNPKMMVAPAHVLEHIKKAKAKGHKVKELGANKLLEVGFISGCRSDQTSADTSVNGKPCGAMTWYVVDTMKKLGKTAVLTKIVADANSALKKDGYDQEPQAEGTRKDKPFLG